MKDHKFLKYSVYLQLVHPWEYRLVTSRVSQSGIPVWNISSILKTYVIIFCETTETLLCYYNYIDNIYFDKVLFVVK